MNGDFIYQLANRVIILETIIAILTKDEAKTKKRVKELYDAADSLDRQGFKAIIPDIG